jgi:hypothetical protein
VRRELSRHDLLAESRDGFIDARAAKLTVVTV